MVPARSYHACGYWSIRSNARSHASILGAGGVTVNPNTYAPQSSSWASWPLRATRTRGGPASKEADIYQFLPPFGDPREPLAAGSAVVCAPAIAGAVWNCGMRAPPLCPTSTGRVLPALLPAAKELPSASSPPTGRRLAPNVNTALGSSPVGRTASSLTFPQRYDGPAPAASASVRRISCCLIPAYLRRATAVARGLLRAATPPVARRAARDRPAPRRRSGASPPIEGRPWCSARGQPIGRVAGRRSALCLRRNRGRVRVRSCRLGSVTAPARPGQVNR